jgi:GDP-4-dehydro-6-deoxy-D-mannose reductase
VQTVLVTGAEGFAGSHVLALLEEHGYEPVAGVRNRARKLIYERQNRKALVCDITDAINVARVIAGVRPGAVIHLAGIACPTDAARDPLLAYQSIVTAWANILDAVRRTVPRARVVLASACDVYGNAGRDGQPLSETTPPQPINTFGSLKRAAETIAHAFYRHYRVNVTIARPFHYTGPGQPDRFFYAAVAGRLTARAAEAETGQLSLPDLSCRRDLLHVRDVAVAYQRIMEDGRPNETYNICSGQALTCREIVERMAAELDLSLNLGELPAGQDDGQIAALRGDNTKLREELNWAPSRTLEETLRELVGSCRSGTETAAQPACSTQ